MGTTFRRADADDLNLLGRAMADWHPKLAEAGVAVGVILALNPDGPAVKHAGYAALATIKVVSLKDRLTKGYDAELLIDESEWSPWNSDDRLLLLDHELAHLTLVELSKKERRRADPGDPWWKQDDLNRPRLKTVPGDWATSDGFKDVVARHGVKALEYQSLVAAKATADAVRKTVGAA